MGDFKLLYSKLIVFPVVLCVTACGGGPSNGSDSVEESLDSSSELVEDDNSGTNELALNLLAGRWEGSLKSYIDGTDTKQCEWNISLNLSDEQVSGSGEVTGGVFYGDVSADLNYAFGVGSERCISDNFEFDWSAICYSDLHKSLDIVSTVFMSADYTCLHDYDRLDGENVDLYDNDKLKSLLSLSRLSYDKTTIKLDRRNRDDTELNLQKGL